MQEIRSRLEQVPRPGDRRPQPDLAPARRAGRHRLLDHGPRPGRAGRLQRQAAHAGCRQDRPASSTSTTRCGSTSRSCWSTSTASGRPRWASTCRRSPRRCGSPSAATTASRATATRSSTTSTTWNCGWWASTAAARDVDRPALRPHAAAAARLGDAAAPCDSAAAARRRRPQTRLDNVVQLPLRPKAPARIDRLDRQRMAAVRANVAPGYALADRIEAVQQAAEEIGLPPGFSTRVMGRGRELERTLPRLPLDLRPLVHLHVPAAGRAVRAPDPSADDSLLAAAGRAVRPGQPVAGRRDAEPLLGPGHPRALRRGEEGLDPAGRPHQPAPRQGHGPPRRPSSRPTATACGRS